MKVKVGDTYESNNYGAFKVVAYNNSKNVDVEFIKTGYITKTQSSDIRKGSVKDRLYPSIYGVGLIGVGEHLPSIKGRHTNPYDTWIGMMRRCYSENQQIENPTYIGCSVCKEWHNFQNFAQWFKANYIEQFVLDKDIKIKGNKIYSPDACMFVSPADNAIESSAKTYSFADPNGDLHDIYNLSAFCRENNLSQVRMSAVHLGKIKHYKGWEKVECDL